MNKFKKWYMSIFYLRRQDSDSLWTAFEMLTHGIAIEALGDEGQAILKESQKLMVNELLRRDLIDMNLITEK